MSNGNERRLSEVPLVHESDGKALPVCGQQRVGDIVGGPDETTCSACISARDYRPSDADLTEQELRIEAQRRDREASGAALESTLAPLLPPGVTFDSGARSNDALGNCPYCYAARAGHATLARGCTCPTDARPQDAPLVPAPVVTDLGCWVCRVLADAVKANALDVAMYEGMIVGARIALGAPPVLCREHAERWSRVGIEAGLQTTVTEAHAQRVDKASITEPDYKSLLQKLVEFIRGDQDQEYCQCCRDYLQVANHVAKQAGLADGVTCHRCDGAGKVGDWDPCRGCGGDGRLAMRVLDPKPAHVARDVAKAEGETPGVASQIRSMLDAEIDRLNMRVRAKPTDLVSKVTADLLGVITDEIERRWPDESRTDYPAITAEQKT